MIKIWCKRNTSFQTGNIRGLFKRAGPTGGDGGLAGKGYEKIQVWGWHMRPALTGEWRINLNVGYDKKLVIKIWCERNMSFQTGNIRGLYKRAGSTSGEGGLAGKRYEKIQMRGWHVRPAPTGKWRINLDIGYD